MDDILGLGTSNAGGEWDVEGQVEGTWSGGGRGLSRHGGGGIAMISVRRSSMRLIWRLTRGAKGHWASDFVDTVASGTEARNLAHHVWRMGVGRVGAKDREWDGSFGQARRSPGRGESNQRKTSMKKSEAKIKRETGLQQKVGRWKRSERSKDG